MRRLGVRSVLMMSTLMALGGCGLWGCQSSTETPPPTEAARVQGASAEVALGRAAGPGAYFSLARLIDEAAAEAARQGYALERRQKPGRGGAPGDTGIHRVDRPDWPSELALFRKGDLARPGWQGFYDTTRRGLITEYRPNRQGPEVTRALVHRDTLGRPVTYVYSIERRNYLVMSQQHGRIDVHYPGGQTRPVLKRARLSGQQQMTLARPFPYEIEVLVQPPSGS